MKPFLKNDVDIFKNLTEAEFNELKGVFCYQKYLKKELIIKEDTAVQHIYFISSGLVKLSYFDEDANEFILSFAFENWWETDFSAFYHQTKATLTLQCLEDTEVYSLSFDDYFLILNKYRKT